MEVSKLTRLQELSRKVTASDGDLSVLTLDELREMARLLRQRLSEEEFGYPVCGED